MKSLLLYTAARVGVFAVTFALIWLIFGRWLEWSTLSGLYTAFIALAVSSGVALVALGSLREDVARSVSTRAERARTAFEARRAAEDDDPPPP